MGLDVGEIGMGADLSLDLRYFAAKALRQQAKDAPASEEMEAYIRRFEEEQRKIEVFKRELPLCARLLADVIDVIKEEKEKKDRKEEEEDGAAGDKSKWMSTAQLWTGGSCRDAVESEMHGKGMRNALEGKSHGGAFTPFKGVGSGAPAFGRPCMRKDSAADVVMPDLSLLTMNAPAPAAAAGAADESRRHVVGFAQEAARAAAMAPAPPAAPAVVNLQPQPQQQQQQARKLRRCWSPELHRQFVAALNQLGGAQVATPKQIREVMKVDGLTNDEVKSHLQKYRLHNRRMPGPAVVSPAPVVVMGYETFWVTHQEQQQSSSHSGSPPGPLHFSTSGGVGVSSAATEEEDGSRSESYGGWK